MVREGATVRESWTAWPVFWTPVIVGALASVVAVVLFGVIGTAVGSWKAGNEGRVTDFSGIGRVAVAYAVAIEQFAAALRVVGEQLFDLFADVGIGAVENPDAVLTRGVVELFDLSPALRRQG